MSSLTDSRVTGGTLGGGVLGGGMGGGGGGEGWMVSRLMSALRFWIEFRLMYLRVAAGLGLGRWARHWR